MQESMKDDEESNLNCEEEFAKQERQLNARAMSEAEAFMIQNKGQCANLSVEQAYLVYKFMMISKELMEKGLIGMIPRGGLSQVGRQLAKQLHPDKNSHP
jgi:hypothetical protein